MLGRPDGGEVEVVDSQLHGLPCLRNIDAESKQQIGGTWQCLGEH